MTQKPVSWACIFCLCLLLAIGGCGFQSRIVPPYTPPAQGIPTWDAKALSGGRITQFQPIFGRPFDTNDKVMLEACRYIPLHSHVARSAGLVVHATGSNRITDALVVGKDILVIPGQVAHDTMTIGGSMTGRAVYGMYQSHPVNFIPGSRYVQVGSTRIKLPYPIFLAADSPVLVMKWADMVRVFQAHDKLIGLPKGVHEIQYPKAHLIYDLNQYSPA